MMCTLHGWLGSRYVLQYVSTSQSGWLLGVGRRMDHAPVIRSGQFPRRGQACHRENGFHLIWTRKKRLIGCFVHVLVSERVYFREECV